MNMLTTAPVIYPLKRFASQHRPFSNFLPFSGLKPTKNGLKSITVRTCSSSNLPPGRPGIQAFYKSRNVLVTGVTGLLGKVLVEKLLRSCRDIGKVYVLIRPKKGSNAKQRLEGLLDAKIFDPLKEKQPAVFQKLVLVQGDLNLPGLGLTEMDEKDLINNVSVVFHSAAVVKSNEEFRTALHHNTGSVVRLVELCKKMTDLKAFVYLSTAYSNLNRLEVDEIVYPLTKDPIGLFKAFQQEWMTNDMVKAIEKILMKDRFRTYVVSKALAETILQEERNNLPIAIVRPSMVTGTWKEPFPGWIDSVYTATGIQIMGMKGIFRSVNAKVNSVADFIPVDICANLLIAVAWHLANNPQNDITIYNCTSGDIQPITWGKVIDLMNHFSRTIPVNEVIWYPRMTPKRFKFQHEICFACFHYFPAICLDIVACLTGRKPRMLKECQMLDAALNALHPFIIYNGKFKSENQWKIWESMSDEEKQEFNFDIRQLDWLTFFESCCRGIKLYLLKEDLSTMPQAQQHLQRLKYIRNFSYLLGILIGGGLIGITFDVIN